MSIPYRSATFLALVVLATGLFAVAPTHAARTLAPSDGTATRSEDPASVIEGSDLDEATRSLLLELVDEARASADDRERFLATTEAITREAVGAFDASSYDLLEEFLTSYHASLSLQTKFEWEIKPHPAKKCNDNFDCVFALGVCVIITWRDGNGSGGINCISQVFN